MSRYSRKSPARRLFSPRHQEALLNAVVSAAGVRLADSLTVDVPLSQVLDGLCRQEGYFRELHERGREMIRAGSYFRPASGRPLPPQVIRMVKAVQSQIRAATAFLQQCRMSPSRPLLIHAFARCAGRIVTMAQGMAQVPSGADASLKQATDEFNRNLRHLWWTAIQLKELLSSAPSSAAAAQCLVITGDAGVGKTHSFADYAGARLTQRRPTVILSARAFTEAPIETALPRAAGMRRRSAVGLFRTVNARGAATGQRALILIDAINESRNPRAWREGIRALARLALMFPHVAVAVSCRSSYVRLALPRPTGTREVPYFQHQGFAGREHEAALRFFAHYDIHAPLTPVLAPEFSNPLFLELFCRTHQNKHSTRPLVGHVGITHTLEQFVKTVGRSLARRHGCEDSAFLWRLLKALAEEMATAPDAYLSVSRAKAIVQARARAGGATGDVYASMLEHGLLAEDVSYAGTPPRPHVVARFTYQRFSDHLRVRYLLKAHLQRDHPERTFATGAVLGDLLRDQYGILFHRGLVEALAVQIPERVGRELFEFLPEALGRSLVEPMLQSLIWRSATAWPPSATVFDFLVKHVRDRESSGQLFDTLLTLAGIPAHPFGAAALQVILRRKKVPRRDFLWSIYLNEAFQEASPLDRLLAWSVSETALRCDPAAALGLATALAWCTTSSNRFVRDRATRGLSHLLGPHPGALRVLLLRFRGVDDPYVIERILAAAASASLHVHSPDALRAIARAAVDLVPHDSAASRNILVRDYLQTMIDGIVRRGVSLPDAVRSGAEWPPGLPWRPQAPSEATLEARYSDEGYGKVKRSVLHMGDFQRYVLDGRVESFVPRTINGRRVTGSQAERALIRAFELKGRSALVQGARGWVFVRTIRWGWNPRLFGEFDRRMTWADTREAYKAERIGKKYQWLALHELLGKLADAMLYVGRFSQLAPHHVQRAREVGVRDFDPTIPTKLLPRRARAEATAWYLPAKTGLRPMPPARQLQWVQSRRSFPDPRRYRNATEPTTGNPLILTDGYVEWLEPAPAEEDRFENPRRKIFLAMRSFLIDVEHLALALKFIKHRRIFEVNLSNHDRLLDAFLAEAAEWQEEGDSDHHAPDWAGHFPMRPTARDYIWEGKSYDGSLGETLRLMVPTYDFAELLKLQWKAPSGRYHDEHDALACWDPGPETAGPSVLLTSAALLERRLATERKALLWTVLGEKVILDSSARRRTYPLPQYFMGAVLVPGPGWTDGLLRSKSI